VISVQYAGDFVASQDATQKIRGNDVGCQAQRYYRRLTKYIFSSKLTVRQSPIIRTREGAIIRFERLRQNGQSHRRLFNV